MNELGMKELKIAMCLPAFCLFMVLLLVLLSLCGFSASSAEEVSTVKGLLSSEEGQRLYNEVWKKPIQDVYQETHISVHIAWVIVPSVMIRDPFAINYDEAKEIVMLAVDKQGETYVEASLDSYVRGLVARSEFNDLNAEKIIKIIEANEDSADVTTIGNIPKNLEDYMRLHLALPVKNWADIGDVGMYNPFGEWTMHYGMDIAVPTGTSVYAAADATVIDVYHDDIGGNTIIIRNGNLVMIYCHMKELSFKKIGEKVRAGDVIGYSGATGKVTGPHLHFETWSTDIKNAKEGFAIENEIFFNPRLLWDFSKK